MPSPDLPTQSGKSYPLGSTLTFPLGATEYPNGVNFSVFSKHSTSAELLLFDDIKDTQPSRIIKLNLCNNKSYHYWHIFVPGLREGQIYGWRMDGPFNPSQGFRYDPTKVLLDPYGKCLIYPPGRDRVSAASVGDNSAKALKNIVIDSRKYYWEEDAPPRHPFSNTVIYEINIGTFTRHPNSGVSPKKRGTYAGVIEKIPYLKDLGITAVELLPIFAFDAEDAPAGLKNGWGYQPLSFFAPHPQYSSRPEPMAALDEFRDMVKALHRAGIEVILDVVFNHTAEGGVGGPTISFRGLSNETYYILGKDKSTYKDFTGCGNTLNANESIVRRLIIDALCYWVEEMHVDGFRFDLASILSRDKDGTPMANPPILWDIESDPVLSTVKLIAEAWDPGGLYQVGSFPGDAWHEWNGRFRDDVRSFVKGNENTIQSLAYRMTGSPDLYLHEEREPEQTINFITCHDGFTLNDLVSYDQKHNEANKEENRDGTDNNLSWNCGVEGPTDNPEIEKLRNRQIKNFLAILFFSVGVPMILSGDEVRRTQLGNNNAYCDLGESTWFDWSLLEKHADIYRFVKQLIKFRTDQKVLCENYEKTLQEFLKEKAIEWHGVTLGAPDLGPKSHSIAATIRRFDDQMMLHIMINAYWEDLTFEIPTFNRPLSKLADASHRASWEEARCLSSESPKGEQSGRLRGQVQGVSGAQTRSVQEHTASREAAGSNAEVSPKGASLAGASELLLEVPEAGKLRDGLLQAGPEGVRRAGANEPNASIGATQQFEAAGEFGKRSNDGHEPWHRCIDTFLESPNDILPWREAPKIIANSYEVKARSVVMLVSSAVSVQ